MKATELHPVIIEFICKQIAQRLYRLGIVTTVSAAKRKRYDGKDFLYFHSQDFPITPALFKRVYVEGTAMSLEDYLENPKWQTMSIQCHFNYEHFDGGENGHYLGTIQFLVSKSLPEAITNDGKDFSDVSYYVRVLRGFEI